MFLTYILPVIIFAAIGALAGILLTIASKVFEVKTDERLDTINEILPQINCGACGYSGCGSYADAVLNEGAATNQCKAGGADTAAKISEIMGVSSAEFVAEVAFVRCSGDCHATTSKYKFEGTQSCAAANRFYSGSEFCTYGCLGFGDCAEICPNEAISVLDNVASVDKTKCVACGLCVKTCPNSLIEIHKISSHVSVACSSTELGKVVKKICTAGCIGCKICEKKCPNSAIHVENNLAKIDYALCTNCGECVSACPVKVIKSCEK